MACEVATRRNLWPIPSSSFDFTSRNTFTSDITIQSTVFLVVSLVSLIVTRPLVKRFKKRNKTTGTNADRHIGQVGFMLTDLTDIDKTAQAKVGAETWTVKSDKAPLLKGTKIKVLAIEGVKLIVEPVTE